MKDDVTAEIIRLDNGQFRVTYRRNVDGVEDEEQSPTAPKEMLIHIILSS